MNDTTFQGDGKVAYVPVVVDTKPKPVTNADRVRSMDDYDLALFLENVSCKHADTESWLDWLRKRVINDGKEEKEENQPAK